MDLFNLEEMAEHLSSAKPMGSKQDVFSLIADSDRCETFFEKAGDQQRFIDAFIALLGNPEQSLCVRHFIGCLGPLEDAVVEGNMWSSSVEHNRSALRLHQHRFLSALLSWTIEPRSKEECKTLWLTNDASDDTDSRCCREAGCNLDDPHVALLHEIERQNRNRAHPRSMACTVFRIMSAVLFSAAEGIKTARSARRVNRAISAARLGQAWPMSIADLLGHYTVQVFFRQLEVWVEAWPVYAYPYEIFGSLALLYPQQFLTLIAQSTIIPFHTVTILNIINELSRMNGQSGKDLLTTSASMMHFLDALLNDFTRPLFLEFVKDDKVATALVVICSRLLKEIPRMLSRENPGQFPGWLDKKADSSTKTLLRLGSTLHAHLEMADDEFHDMEFDSRLLEMSHAKRQKNRGTITLAFDGFCSLAEWQRCSAPGCSGMVAPEALRKCANCTRVLYCSPTCQKEAWRHHGAPHKELCKLAAVLADHTGLPARPSSSDLDSFSQRIDGNEEMEKAAKEFGECFQKLVNSLGEGMTAGRP
ncbi:hypothetical protein FB451DRAFT_1268763 [Mycena latifolia]|nr:hypothetical protein FB451DRAFT_1268763 [Mycena latifolia]